MSITMYGDKDNMSSMESGRMDSFESTKVTETVEPTENIDKSESDKVDFSDCGNNEAKKDTENSKHNMVEEFNKCEKDDSSHQENKETVSKKENCFDDCGKTERNEKQRDEECSNHNDFDSCSKTEKVEESLNDSSCLELPTCFNELPDDTKLKQIEALNRMSESERQTYLDIVKKEPEITEDIQDITNINGGQLQGLEYRVKTPSSTYEKMHEREETTDISEMKDIIRYTEIYPVDNLAAGTNDSLKEFESRGYTVDRIKNTWDNENAVYRGINVNLTSPDGQTFEVQFHTQESFELKNGELHSLYEQRRTMAEDNPKAYELDERMISLSSSLERPYNIDEVKNK